MYSELTALFSLAVIMQAELYNVLTALALGELTLPCPHWNY